MKPFSETKDNIRDVLAKHEVAVGYVFGSYATGRTGPLSDVDIAVMFNANVPRGEYFERELSLANDVGKLLQVKRVDVVNIETVKSPLLKHRAVIRGVSVLDQDHARRTQLEQRVLQEYEDTENLRRAQREIMRRQLKAGTFGNPLISPYAYGTS